MTHSKGGAGNGSYDTRWDEGPEELGDFAPGGCVPGGVPSSDPPDPVAAAEPVAAPQPVFVSVFDPNNSGALTVLVPFGVALTVTHGNTVTAKQSSAFPDSRAPEPS
jgi:hypothetical protein